MTLPPHSMLALNAAETYIANAASRGERADLQGWPPVSSSGKPTVRADVIRRLLLGLPLPGGAVYCLRAFGLHISGAQIVDKLDLSGCTAWDRAGPPLLVLKGCDLTSGADFSDARLSLLSLKNSRISHVSMRGLTLDGILDISGIKGRDDAETATIDARGGVFGGEVRALRMMLRAKLGNEIALDLSGAQIGGGLSLGCDYNGEDASKFYGRLFLDGAVLRGDLWALHVSVNATVGPALSAVGARVGGMVRFDSLQAAGGISLYGATIGAMLVCDGASLTQGPGGEKVECVLDATNARIGADLLLSKRFVAEACVQLLATRIGGNLQCNGDFEWNRALSAQQKDKTAALMAERSEIGGHVNFYENFTAIGAVNFLKSTIHGNFQCEGGKFLNHSEDNGQRALDADNAKIGGDVQFRDGFKAEGLLRFAGARIEQNLTMKNVWLRNDHGACLEARDARIGSGVNLGEAEEPPKNEDQQSGKATESSKKKASRFVALDGVVFAGAQIAGDFTCEACDLRASGDLASADEKEKDKPLFALDARNLEVSGDLKLKDVNVVGSLGIEHAQIGGSLEWDGLRFPLSFTAKFGPEEVFHCGYEEISCGTPEPDELKPCLPQTFKAAHARIEAALRARNLETKVGLKIDLGSTRAHTLSDIEERDPKSQTKCSGSPSNWSKVLRWKRNASASGQNNYLRGWGIADAPRRAAADRNPHLILDGFVYERIEHFPNTRGLSLIKTLKIQIYKALAIFFENAPQWIPGRALRDRIAGWSGKRIKLLESDRQYDETEMADLRTKWLDYTVTEKTSFYPQPYRQLAEVMRKQGHHEAARGIAQIEQKRTTRAGWFRWGFYKIFGICYGYGLNTNKAVLTLLIVWLIGWTMVDRALSREDPHYPRVGPVAVATFVATLIETHVPIWLRDISLFDSDKDHRPDSGNSEHHHVLALSPAVSAEKILEEGLVRSPRSRRKAREHRPCEPYDIVPLFYALDMMVPIVPLHQVERCEVAAHPANWLWQYAWAAFSLVGKIAVSFALLTFSGVLKTREDDE